MEEKLYRIQEVARLHNITKKTLLYYEKIGLFKPCTIDEYNGYRYYRRVDFPLLKHIIYLKDIGFSLTEIKELLDRRSHKLMLEYLEKRQAEVQKQLSDLRKIEEAISIHIGFNEIAKEITPNDLNRPSVRIYPERKILGGKSKKVSKEGVMLTYRKIFNYLRSLNMLSHKAYGSIYYLGEETESVGAFIELPDTFCIEGMSVLEAGKYICMYHKGSYCSEKSVAYFLSWLKDNHYEPIGNCYDYCIVDWCYTNDENEMILELQVKVK